MSLYMRTLRNLLTPRSKDAPGDQQLLQTLCEQTGLKGKEKLYLNYPAIFKSIMARSKQPVKLLGLLVSKIEHTQCPEELIKLFTLVHWYIREVSYEARYVAVLESIALPKIVLEKEKEEWQGHFIEDYSFYLLRISSMVEVYQKAKHNMEANEQGAGQFQGSDSINSPSSVYTIIVHEPMALTSIFRILNQFRQIGTSTNNALNRVGRYYEYRQAIYGDFYQVLNAEIVSLYLYLKDVISGFTTNFRKRDTQELNGFLEVLKDIQLVSDKLQDLICNRYFRGKAIKSKLTFNEQKIEEIKYFLKTEKLLNSMY